MLHQIRKMVGLTIAMARGLASLETLQRAWKTERLDLPVAPGLGLILEEVNLFTINCMTIDQKILCHCCQRLTLKTILSQFNLN